MLLPFAKLFSLCLRLFTRPAVALITSAYRRKLDHSLGLQSFLITTGQLYHQVLTRSQRGLANSKWKQPVKPLSEAQALEAGVGLAAEGLAYGVLFLWGVYEVKKMLDDGRSKEERQRELLGRLRTEVERVEVDNTDLEEVLRTLQARAVSDPTPKSPT